jgi:hypothetical protein
LISPRRKQRDRKAWCIESVRMKKGGNLSGAEVNYLLTLPGSSVGKIGKTGLIHTNKVLKNFNRLTKTRQKLYKQRSHLSILS